MKKLISILLSAVITAGIFTAVPLGAVAAKWNVRLKKSSATLKITEKKGKPVYSSTKIKLVKAKGVKITKKSFKSSDKKTATVTKGGKVTAKKAGKAKITVTVKYTLKNKKSSKKVKKNSYSKKLIFNVTVQDVRTKKNVVLTPSEATAQPTEPVSEATEKITEAPTAEQTTAPTEETTAEPTEAPTEETTAEPTEAPTEETTAESTEAPTEETTAEPTEAPTEETTAEPTAAATEETTAEPTEAPTEETTAEETTEPTEAPTEETTAEPTAAPTKETTAEPTEEYTEVPAAEPTEAPTEMTTVPDEKPTTEPEYDPLKRKEYSGEFLDKNTATYIDERFWLYDLEIIEIYSDCFIASDGSFDIKVNGNFFDSWDVYDDVDVLCDNVYSDQDSGRLEGDAVEVRLSMGSGCDLENPCKPVIYLYPEEELNASVKLLLDGMFTCTYPEYNDGWNVTARPDGTLIDEKGMEYNYLFWEGKLNTKYDFSKGFCVKGSDTAAFLDQALEKTGLNRREANEFITYWLPKMQDNPYNIISFQQEAYTNPAPLYVDPNPDTVIRVFMAWYPVNEYTELPAQELTAPERNGFTVVEWGGAQAGR